MSQTDSDPHIAKPDHVLTTRALYIGIQVLMLLLTPIAFFLLALRAVKEPGHLRGIRERFGFGPVGPKGAVWIYAASLGETRAASPLIKRLREHDIPVLLTHMSPAGMEEGWRLFPNDLGIIHRFVPLDLFGLVRLFLFRAKPAIGIVMEIEIWPAMLIESRRVGVPMILANGNLLERSMGELKGLRRHLMALYKEFSYIFTRTQEHYDRYIQIGVEPARLCIVGEMKYDQWIDPAHPLMGRSLRARWSVERVLMIASSVKDEEPILQPVVEAVLAQDSGLGVVWVPRSPQRFAPLAAKLEAAGVPILRRTYLDAQMDGPIAEGTRVIIGDSIGEMNAYYPMADLVFVGASLIDHGGHNIMEPMALGRPVIMGPSIYGIAFAAGPAAEAGAFESTPDAATLVERIAHLLDDQDALARMSAAATAFAASQTGAAERTFLGCMKFYRPRAAE